VTVDGGEAYFFHAALVKLLNLSSQPNNETHFIAIPYLV